MNKFIVFYSDYQSLRDIFPFWETDAKIKI